MRVLLTTRGSSGHLGPLVPFAHACLTVGHEVLVAAQGRHRANVERARLPFAPVGDLRDEDWMPLLADHAQLDFEAANARMRSEEHTAELQSHVNVVCRLLLGNKTILHELN